MVLSRNFRGTAATVGLADPALPPHCSLLRGAGLNGTLPNVTLPDNLQVRWGVML